MAVYAGSGNSTWIDVPPGTTPPTGAHLVYAADLERIENALTLALYPPLFSGYATTAQTTVSGTHLAVVLGAETFDSDNFHSTTTNPSRVIPTVPGVYQVSGVVCFNTTTTAGTRNVNLRKNGTEIRGGTAWLSGGGSAATRRVAAPNVFVQMNGTTDYVEMFAYQDSGANMDLEVGAQASALLLIRVRAA